MDGLTLPGELRPRWRDLSVLSWTLACAYAEGPVWFRRLIAILFAPMLWLPLLAGYHAYGGVARCSRHAVLLLSGTSARGRLSRTVTALTVLTVQALFAALLLIMIEVERMLTGRMRAPVTVAVMNVVTVLLVIGCLPYLWVVPRLLQLRRAQRAGLISGWDEAVHGDMLAAWPRGCGHGSALLTELQARFPEQGHVIALARNQRVAALYGKFGLRPVEAGSLVLTNRPVSDRTAARSLDGES